MLTPGQWTHRRKCPHLLHTQEIVVDQVAMPTWLPGYCKGTTPILVLGPQLWHRETQPDNP